MSLFYCSAFCFVASNRRSIPLPFVFGQWPLAGHHAHIHAHCLFSGRDQLTRLRCLAIHIFVSSSAQTGVALAPRERRQPVAAQMAGLVLRVFRVRIISILMFARVGRDRKPSLFVLFSVSACVVFGRLFGWSVDARFCCYCVCCWHLGCVWLNLCLRRTDCARCFGDVGV